MFMELTEGNIEAGDRVELSSQSVRSALPWRPETTATSRTAESQPPTPVTGRILGRVVGLDLASSGNEAASAVGRRLDQATLGGLPVPTSTLLAPAQAQHFHLLAARQTLEENLPPADKTHCVSIGKSFSALLDESDFFDLPNP
jgi:hypothetical protein